MKVADIIISKLDGVHAKLDELMERVAKLEHENFLLQEYKPEENLTESPKKLTETKPKGPFKPRASRKYKRGKTQLPPSIARELREDSRLAEGTKTSYAGFLDKILREPNSFQAVITMRNDGVRSKDIAAHMQVLHANSTFTKYRHIDNCITVARRYGLTELVDKQYVFTDKFHENKRG